MSGMWFSALEDLLYVSTVSHEQIISNPSVYFILGEFYCLAGWVAVPCWADTGAGFLLTVRGGLVPGQWSLRPLRARTRPIFRPSLLVSPH